MYAPRSYVGHMWRKQDDAKTKLKYKLPAEKALGNRARAMLAHAPKMFAAKTIMYSDFKEWKENKGSTLDVSSIREPLEKLQCKSFEWYLDFFNYIYRDAGFIPKQVFQMTPDNGATCLGLKGDTKWGGHGYSSDKLAMAPCSPVAGLEASNGTQYWHDFGQDSTGKCCNSLKVWNCDQCLSSGLSTGSCKLKASVTASLSDDGLLRIGTKCLGVNPLALIDCNGASKWQKLRPFVPQEFQVLSTELQERW